MSGLIGKAIVDPTSNSIRDYVSGLVERAALIEFPGSFERQTSEDGYRIRSHVRIPFNTEKTPLPTASVNGTDIMKDYAEKYCIRVEIVQEPLFHQTAVHDLLE